MLALVVKGCREVGLLGKLPRLARSLQGIWDSSIPGRSGSSASTLPRPGRAQRETFGHEAGNRAQGWEQVAALRKAPRVSTGGSRSKHGARWARKYPPFGDKCGKINRQREKIRCGAAPIDYTLLL